MAYSSTVQQTAKRACWRAIALCGLLLSLVAGSKVMADEVKPKIVLQLPWTHQFQFAGYYAAIEQGFYAAEGLPEIEVREGSSQSTPSNQLMTGQAHFGVEASEVLFERLNGKPFVQLAVFFQHSPYAILTRKDSNISHPGALLGNRLMMSQNHRDAELLAMLKREGVSLERLQIVPHTWNVEDLIQNKTDGVVVYATNEPYFLKARDIPYNLIKPINYGIDFYGDGLFTTEKFLEEHPDHVAAFRRASIKGWDYAFQHPEHVIDVILNKYKARQRGITPDHLRFQVDAMQQLILPKLVEIGHINPGRLQKMAEVYLELGMVSATQMHRLEGFAYTPELGLKWVRWMGLAVGAFAIFCGLTAWANYRLRLLIRARTQALDQKNMALVREITEREKAELAVRRSEECYRQIVETASEGIWLVDGLKVTTYVNQQLSEMLGYLPGEIIGRSIVEFLDPEAVKAYEDFTKNSQNCTSGEKTDVCFRRRDGSLLWASCSTSTIFGPQGEMAGALAMVTDITKRKHAEIDLREAVLVAQTANRAKTEFLANMSHEIRTPLGAILGFTELFLSQNQALEDQRKSAAIIKRNGQQLLKIIDEILDLSKIEAGRLAVERIPVTLPDLVREVIWLLNSHAQEKGIRLVVTSEGPIPTTILSDPTRLRQILTNIVGNAIKFTEKGRVIVTAGLHRPASFQASAQLYFRVSDTGTGLTPEQQSRIFHPFAQADNSTTRKFGGTGLGLALSQRMSRLLGGDLVLVESKPGCGSTFLITLDTGPLMDVPMVNNLVQPAAPHEGSYNTGLAAISPAAALTPRRLDGVRVLLVEDAPDNRLLVNTFLKLAGATVDFAENGLEGIEKARTGCFDIVLMDIQMPEVDGYEATYRLRSEGFSHPIIALTAHAMKEERDRCLKVGCNDHLTKPVNRTALIDAVAKHTLRSAHA